MKQLSMLLFLFFSFQLLAQNQSGVKCLIGDCNNGYGIAQQQGGTFRQGFFTDGSPTGMEMIMGKGYMLVNVFETEGLFSVRFGMFKKGKDIVITNNTKHYGLEFNLSKRIFNKITLDEKNMKTISRTPLKDNNINKGCIVGDCENGFGMYVYDGGSYAVGEWSNGKRNGIVYLYNTKGTYYGEYKMDKREGYGTYIFSKTGSFLSGQWVNGMMEGKGVYHINNKRFNAGYFSKGKITKMITSTEKEKSTTNVNSNQNNNNVKEQCLSGDCENGYGIYKYKGEIYRNGYWKNGDATGVELLITNDYRAFNNKVGGKVQISYYKQGSKIIVGHRKTKTGFMINLQEGTFKEVTFNDDFKMVTKMEMVNNKVSKGCVAGDCTNGIGVYKYESSYLAANFKNGKADEFGYHHFLSKNQTYVGEYENGIRSGLGIFYYKLWGEYYMGEWKNNKENGKGVRHYSVSKYKEGAFKDGEFIN